MAVIWTLLLIALVVLIAAAVAAVATKRAPARSPRRRIQANYGDAGERRASPRPLEWEGPTPSALLDDWTSREGQYTLRWWQFEHLVAEFFRREGFESVVVRESDLDDGGIDIDANYAGLPLIAQVKHYAADEYASIKDIGRFCHTTRTAGAAMGYFVTSGQIGKNSRIEAGKADPPVTIVSGPSLWKMVQAQRASRPSGLVKPEPRSVSPPASGCAAALLTLGRIGRR